MFKKTIVLLALMVSIANATPRLASSTTSVDSISLNSNLRNVLNTHQQIMMRLILDTKKSNEKIKILESRNAEMEKKLSLLTVKGKEKVLGVELKNSKKYDSEFKKYLDSNR